MLPTCIGISGVSRYRNDASIGDSFLASLIVPSHCKSRGALAALLGVQALLCSARRFRIVHFPEANMQWQTGRIDQIAWIGPRSGPNDPPLPKARLDSPP